MLFTESDGSLTFIKALILVSRLSGVVSGMSDRMRLSRMLRIFKSNVASFSTLLSLVAVSICSVKAFGELFIFSMDIVGEFQVSI